MIASIFEDSSGARDMDRHLMSQVAEEKKQKRIITIQKII